MCSEKLKESSDRPHGVPLSPCCCNFDSVTPAYCEHVLVSTGSKITEGMDGSGLKGWRFSKASFDEAQRNDRTIFSTGHKLGKDHGTNKRMELSKLLYLF